MSFSIAFTARSVSSAKSKLQEAYAPATVKALIEKALDALPPAAIPPVHQASQATNHSGQAEAKRKPEFVGVLVECWGHIGDPGDHGKSYIDRFVVQPLFD
jgi:hypothetical protein